MALDRWLPAARRSAQIGADIYCGHGTDSDELERRTHPQFPTQSKFRPASWTRSRKWADNQLFSEGAIAYLFQSKAMAFIYRRGAGRDRRAFGGGPRGDGLGRRERQRPTLLACCASICNRSTVRWRAPWLLGKHPRWQTLPPITFALVRAPHHTTGRHPSSTQHVLPWMDCVAAPDMATPAALPALTPSASRTRLNVRSADWRNGNDEHGIAAGDRWTVTPARLRLRPGGQGDWLRDGEVLTLRRFDERASGSRAFPAVGFKLEKAH